MPKIPDYIVRRIVDTARIEDVVGDFVQLRKTGARYTGLCPFHEDRHDGNFIVYPRGNCFRCFTCETKGGCVDFVMKKTGMTYPDAIRWLGRKYGIETDDIPVDYVPPPLPPPPPPLPMLTLPSVMVTAREHYDNDNLVQWINTGIAWDNAQRHRIPEMLKAYHIGHSHALSDFRKAPYGVSEHDFTMFWEIDDQQRVRTGKMMKYKPDGHRDRESFYNFDWVHAAISRPRIMRDHYGDAILEDGEPVYQQPFLELYDEEKQQVEHCLFGLHLIDAYGPNATVCIVESEKTALLMSIAYGNNPMTVWMACGGESNLTRERLLPIISRRRKVLLYPDRDGIGKWMQKASQIGYDQLTVDTTPVTQWWKESDGKKADIADVVIRLINGSTYHPKTVGEVAREIPAVKQLIENLDLEIVDENK